MKINVKGRTTKQRRWTRQAIECYYLGGICEKCSLLEDFKPHCHMKAAIIQLVEQEIPIPEKMKQERHDILEDE